MGLCGVLPTAASSSLVVFIAGGDLDLSIRQEDGFRLHLQAHIFCEKVEVEPI